MSFIFRISNLEKMERPCRVFWSRVSRIPSFCDRTSVIEVHTSHQGTQTRRGSHLLEKTGRAVWSEWSSSQVSPGQGFPYTKGGEGVS